MKTNGQHQAANKRKGNHQCGFDNQLQRNLMLTAAKELSRGHFLGAEACIGHCQVDVVAHGKEQYGQYCCQQDAEPRLVAFL